MSKKSIILELKKITKHFPGVLANDKVSLSIEKGEIHALVGENGAGKSTLMKIAAGIYKPDHGDIFVDGVLRTIRSPQDAFSCGISAVHQEFMLVNSLTVLENIVLGFEPKKALGFLDFNEANQQVAELGKKYGLDVPLMATVSTLPVAIRQQVEILKALYKNARILILDEPTAVLTPQEISDLFKALKSLKNMGTTIIFVTHKLKEVLSVADRVTVMRGGVVQGTLPVAEVTEEELARMMVGREVVFQVKKIKKKIDPSSPVLEVKNVNLVSLSGFEILINIDLTIASGEILGVAGVAGNGQTELVEVITGFTKPNTGNMKILGNDFGFISPRLFRADSSYVCQDRREVGSSPKQSLWENIIIGLESDRRFSTPFGTLKRLPIHKYAQDIVKRFDVHTPTIFTPASSLSGGNLQRLILGRELSKEPFLLVAEDPTRGLDVGATEYVHKEILQFAAMGKGVLLVSQDLNELLMLSDRIIVIYKGELVGEVLGDEATPELVGLFMLGLKKTDVYNKVKQ